MAAGAATTACLLRCQGAQRVDHPTGQANTGDGIQLASGRRPIAGSNGRIRQCRCRRIHRGSQPAREIAWNTIPIDSEIRFRIKPHEYAEYHQPWMLSTGSCHGYYHQFGFEETGRVPFDPAQTPPDWDRKDGAPICRVYEMEWLSKRWRESGSRSRLGQDTEKLDSDGTGAIGLY